MIIIIIIMTNNNNNNNNKCLYFAKKPRCVTTLKTAVYTGKNNWFPILDILGYLKKSHKNPKFGKVRQVPTREFQPSSLVGTCLTLPNLEFLWVFFKYPKISKNGNLQEPLLESVIFPVEADQVAGGRAWACAWGTRQATGARKCAARREGTEISPKMGKLFIVLPNNEPHDTIDTKMY